MIMPAEYFTTGHDAACSPPETGIETHCACSVNVVPMRSDGEYSVRTWLRNGFFAVLVLANWRVPALAGNMDINHAGLHAHQCLCWFLNR